MSFNIHSTSRSREKCQGSFVRRKHKPLDISTGCMQAPCSTTATTPRHHEDPVATREAVPSLSLPRLDSANNLLVPFAWGSSLSEHFKVAQYDGAAPWHFSSLGQTWAEDPGQSPLLLSKPEMALRQTYGICPLH